MFLIFFSALSYTQHLNEDENVGSLTGGVSGGFVGALVHL